MWFQGRLQVEVDKVLMLEGGTVQGGEEPSIGLSMRMSLYGTGQRPKRSDSLSVKSVNRSISESSIHVSEDAAGRGGKRPMAEVDVDGGWYHGLLTPYSAAGYSELPMMGQLNRMVTEVEIWDLDG